jgi:hypothetical protein
MADRSRAWPRHAHTYRLPALLTDIRLLDLLELSGSTRQASRLLQISQPSVSRRYRALAEDFALRAAADTHHGCRFGSNATMRLLRLSCRCHRLQAGVARVGTDLLHHGLLNGLPWLLPAPPRFRPLREWLELVRQGVLDGALVSELELEREGTLDAPDLDLHRLGPLPLALARAPAAAPGTPAHSDPVPVLVPAQALAAGLRSLLSRQGWTLRSVGSGCVAPEQWHDQVRRRGCAMPVGGPAGPAGARTGDLERLPLPAGTVSPVWLALPGGSTAEPLLRHTLERLQAHPALAG